MGKAAAVGDELRLGIEERVGQELSTGKAVEEYYAAAFGAPAWPIRSCSKN